MRVVLDPNVLIAALLSAGGAPARLLLRWLDGEFELVISEQLLVEFRRACSYPKISRRVSAEAVSALDALLRESAEFSADPARPPRRSPDPGDDYLLALAESGSAILVTGDRHLLDLGAGNLVRSPREFLAMLDAAG